MNGTFNGIRLSSITFQKLTPTRQGTILYSFRVAGKLPNPELEAALLLQAPALLILGNVTIEGLIASYSEDIVSGYEVTIELSGIKRNQDAL
jgi:hypothetical protein